MLSEWGRGEREGRVKTEKQQQCEKLISISVGRLPQCLCFNRITESLRRPRPVMVIQYYYYYDEGGWCISHTVMHFPLEAESRSLRVSTSAALLLRHHHLLLHRARLVLQMRTLLSN